MEEISREMFSHPFGLGKTLLRWPGKGRLYRLTNTAPSGLPGAGSSGLAFIHIPT